jgi:hypothetical protein
MEDILASSSLYTYQDYLSWPSDERWEIIELRFSRPFYFVKSSTMALNATGRGILFKSSMSPLDHTIRCSNKLNA